MTPDGTGGRPLSPHLQVWRFHWTMAASITHRFTGVGNYVCTSLLGVWIMIFALGGGGVERAVAMTSGLIGFVFWLVLWGFTTTLGYHLINGVRHLVWDAGYGFDPDQANKVSVMIFIAAAVISLAALVLGLLAGGVIG